jgi:hypothetical protein
MERVKTAWPKGASGLRQRFQHTVGTHAAMLPADAALVSRKIGQNSVQIITVKNTVNFR